MKKYRNKIPIILMGLVFFFVAYAPVSALAQEDYSINQSDLAVDSSDWGIKLFLSPILGQSFDGSVESIDSPFSQMILAFSSFILVLAGIYAIYTITLGMINTAHDGTMLGNKMESHMLPIRTFLGSALLVPVFKGFSASQIIIIYLVMQSIGGANYINRQAIETDNLMVSNFNARPSYQKVRDLAEYLLVANVCMEKNNQMLETGTGNYNDDKIISKAYINKGRTKSNLKISGSYMHYAFYNESNAGNSPESVDNPCGRVQYYYSATFDPNKSVKNNNSDSTFNRENIEKTKTLTTITQGITEGKQAIDSEVVQQFALLQGKINSMAKVFVSRNANYSNETLASYINNKLDEYSQEYVQNVRQAGINAYQNSDAMKDERESIAEDGAIFAGFYALRVNTIQNAFNSSMQNLPEGVVNIKDNSPYLFTEQEYNAINSAITGEKTSQYRADNFQRNKENAIQDTNIDEGGTPGAETAWNFLIDIAGETLTNGENENIGANLGGTLISLVIDPDDHLLVSMQKMSNLVKNIALGIFASATASSVSILGTGIGDGTAMFLYGIGMSLLSIYGLFFMAQLLIPFMWLSFLITYGLGVIVAILGAPLMALALLAPMSEGLIGKGRQGLLTIGALMLSFPITVIGVYLSFAIISSFGSFLNMIITSLFQQTGTVEGLAGVIIVPILYFVFSIAIIRIVATTLIANLASKIFEWIGEGAPNIMSGSAENANTMVSDTKESAAQTSQTIRSNTAGSARRFTDGASNINKGYIRPGMSKGMSKAGDSFRKTFGGEASRGTMSGDSQSEGSSENGEN